MRFLFPVFLAFSLAGCAGLPGQGPAAITITSEEIEGDAVSSDYVLLSLDRQTISAVHDYRPALFSRHSPPCPVPAARRASASATAWS